MVVQSLNSTFFPPLMGAPRFSPYMGREERRLQGLDYQNGGQTLPFRSNFAGRNIEMRMRRMRRVHWTMRTKGMTAFSKRCGVVVWTGENDTKTISVDANLIENGAKQLRFRLKTD